LAQKFGVTKDNYDPNDLRQNMIVALSLLDNIDLNQLPGFDSPKVFRKKKFIGKNDNWIARQANSNYTLISESGLNNPNLPYEQKMLYYYNRPGTVRRGNAQGNNMYVNNVIEKSKVVYPQKINMIELPTVELPSTTSAEKLYPEVYQYGLGGILKFQKGSKLPTLPTYYNPQQTQDNVVRQYNPITNPDERFIAAEKGRQLRIAEKEKELKEYYSQPGMVSGMKRKPNASEIRYEAEKSVNYNDAAKSDPIGTFGPDIALSFIPELLMFKGPQQAISRGLNKINSFKSYNPWSKPTQNTIKQVDDIPTPKFVSAIDWAKWNRDTPKHKVLIDEYNAIEESTKKAGTWMKNPDGSTFIGSNPTAKELLKHGVKMSPEEAIKAQFIQQQSSWFKKSFPNIVKDDVGNVQINYHGQREGKPFNIFKPSTRGSHGVGNYTFPNNKNASLRYANYDEERLYSLYINSNNPQKTIESVFSPEFNEITGRLQPGYDYLRIGKEQVTPESNYLKSALGNVGFYDMLNPNIYKALLPVGLGTGLYNKTTNN